MVTKRYKTINEYFESYPKDIGEKLKIIKQIALKIAPKATPVISYNMPAFKVNGKIFIYFSAHTKHIGLYPYPSTIKAFKKESAKYITGPGTIQFPYNQKLPVNLITKIMKFRYKEVIKSKRK